MTIGETTADAPRPLFGTIENAIPSAVEQALAKGHQPLDPDELLS